MNSRPFTPAGPKRLGLPFIIQFTDSNTAADTHRLLGAIGRQIGNLFSCQINDTNYEDIKLQAQTMLLNSSAFRQTCELLDGCGPFYAVLLGKNAGIFTTMCVLFFFSIVTYLRIISAAVDASIR